MRKLPAHALRGCPDFLSRRSTGRELFRHCLGLLARRGLLGRAFAAQILDHLLADRVGAIEGDRFLETDFGLFIVTGGGICAHLVDSNWKGTLAHPSRW